MPADSPWWYPDRDGSGVLVVGDTSTNGVPGRSVVLWDQTGDPGASAMPGDQWLRADLAPPTLSVMRADRSWLQLYPTPT
jgi:hypothetical protein